GRGPASPPLFHSPNFSWPFTTGRVGILRPRAASTRVWVPLQIRFQPQSSRPARSSSRGTATPTYAFRSLRLASQKRNQFVIPNEVRELRDPASIPAP